jgi:hypothetical protein
MPVREGSFPLAFAQDDGVLESELFAEIAERMSGGV